MRSFPALHFPAVTPGRIWAFFFVYAVATALLLQLVVLPFLLPGLHAGNGLLVGGDWVGFHAIAAELAGKIHAQGWSVWELRPKQQAPSGIAAALYVLTVPHPWVLVPLNAAIHATTGVVLVRIMQSFVPDLRHALACVLPFMLFPSAMTWYVGIFLSLYGGLVLARLETWNGRAGRPLLGLLWIFVGCLLIWVVRPYGIKLMQGIGAIFALMLVPLFVFYGLRRKLPAARAVVSVLIVLAVPVALGVYKGGGAGGVVTVASYGMLSQTKLEQGILPGQKMEGETKGPVSTGPVGSFAVKADIFFKQADWQRTDWLPVSLDEIFFTLAVVRAGYTKGASDVDADVVFHSAVDFIPYLPRALQIGFAAPFPTQWFGQGSSEATTVMRRISALEMIVVYCALLFLPYALWLWRRRIEIWLTLSFCTILLLIYAYILPNVGTLYRTRYGFLMMIVALGVAGAISVWRDLHSKTT